MEAQITSILSVLQLAERLKFELRHSYTSSGRQESVAKTYLENVFNGCLD